jgi:hypothetical protein
LVFDIFVVVVSWGCMPPGAPNVLATAGKPFVQVPKSCEADELPEATALFGASCPLYVLAVE